MSAAETGADARGELAALAAALAAHARRGAWMGIGRVARPIPAPGAPPIVELAPAPPPTAPAAEARAPAAGDAPVEENRRLAAACADLEELAARVAACRACPLCETRTQTVFSDGTGRARVMFVGEAPGEHEDRQGVPFVGRAGRLLTDIVEKGMGLAREDVYIANVLKCRPPGNRDPAPAEKERCTPWLDRQIELVDPEVLVTLGLHASQHVLGSPAPMRRLRGRVHRARGRKVVATYHPAYLLRSPHMKKACWEDIQLAMAELGLPPAARR